MTPRRRESPTFLDAAHLHGLRLLVVDDDAAVRDAITEVLRHYGGRVTAVGSVTGAMAAMARERPDLILSDLRMPGQDGYDLIRQVRALPAELGGCAIPAIALTASDGRAEQRRAIRAGFYLLLPKPVTPGGLVRAVAAVAASRLGSTRSQVA